LSLVGALCLAIMKIVDPKWTKAKAKEIGLEEDEY